MILWRVEDEHIVAEIREKCRHCGKKGHAPEDCRVFRMKVKCHKCGGLGHLKVVCNKRGSAFNMKATSTSLGVDKITRLEEQMAALQDELRREKERALRRGSNRMDDISETRTTEEGRIGEVKGSVDICGSRPILDELRHQERWQTLERVPR
eukprot:GHVP01069796.1.p1 GENE.GHVP01069796.1~~GHVP01069796.1.p1  ORF type:complete len:152 (+),score=12.08 GHVP01069796.1:809-1264(+)